MSHNSSRQLWDSCAAAQGMRATLLHSRLIFKKYLIFIFFPVKRGLWAAGEAAAWRRCGGRPRGGAGGPAGAAAASWLGADPGLDRSPASVLPPRSRSRSPAACQRRASRRRSWDLPLPPGATTTGWCPGGTKGTPPFPRWTEVSGKLGVGRQVFSVHPLSSSLPGVEECPTAYACAQDHEL